ncbi:unnamed protein product [Notodromas monacha]|uniref:Ig-like domain-containing protein n=1 Tax=Notodromas monacha TaxID=399045 RepID=A0A7R9C0G2_9CRUS|nr:unnamed protein product [Notodromas monacha]CAG0924035.1 unnamed protein product [Notodromas monacha]
MHPHLYFFHVQIDDISKTGNRKRSSANDWNEDTLYGTPDYSKMTKDRPIPFFDNSTSQEVFVAAGTTAVLQCKVRNLGQMALSWFRKKDYHILTSGRHSFTNDDRFTPLHQEGSDEWLLQMKNVKMGDNGTYQCQVATPNGILSRKIELTVVVPEAFILGANKDYHTEKGTSFTLVCIVEKVATPNGILSRKIELTVVIPEAFILGANKDYHTEKGTSFTLVCIVEKLYPHSADSGSGSENYPTSGRETASVLVAVFRTACHTTVWFVAAAVGVYIKAVEPRPRRRRRGKERKPPEGRNREITFPRHRRLEKRALMCESRRRGGCISRPIGTLKTTNE